MIYLDLLKPQGIDFPQYYDAVRTLLSGFNPYIRLHTFPGPFNYPPTAFLFIYWFGLLPEWWASVVWNLLSFGSYLFSVYLLLKVQGKVSVLKWIFVCLLVTLFFFPEKFNLGNGQINNFILLLVVLGFCLENTRSNLSAFFLSLATVVKLIPGIFLLDKIIIFDRKYLAKFFAWSVIFLGLSFLLVPISFQTEYFGKVFFQAFPVGGKAVYYNQSLTGFLARSFTHAQTAQYLSWLLSAGLLGLTIYRYRRLSVAERFSALACLYLMLNPLAWQHHFVFAVIPLLLLFPVTLKEKTKLVILAVSYLLISWNFKNPGRIGEPFKFLLSNQFLGIFLLWVLATFGKLACRVVTLLWITFLPLGYLLIVLCKAKFCF